MDYKDIIHFWFEEMQPTEWFKEDEALDLKMTERFIAIHESAILGELSSWRRLPLGRLAEIIIIDQFSRNIYRGEAKSFLYDSMALTLAQEALRGSIQNTLAIKAKPSFKQFLYMPFMHSESKVIHQTALKLFSEPGLASSLEYELQHKAIIDRFGRYPHRNKILGRTSTAEEEKFLMENEAISETANGSWHKPRLEGAETHSVH